METRSHHLAEAEAAEEVESIGHVGRILATSQSVNAMQVILQHIITLYIPAYTAILVKGPISIFPIHFSTITDDEKQEGSHEHESGWTKGKASLGAHGSLISPPPYLLFRS